VRLLCVCVILCVGRGLATGRGFEVHSKRGCLCTFILCVCDSVCGRGLATG
jgi:hypothetical protein